MTYVFKYSLIPPKVLQYEGWTLEKDKYNNTPLMIYIKGMKISDMNISVHELMYENCKLDIDSRGNTPVMMLVLKFSKIIKDLKNIEKSLVFKELVYDNWQTSENKEGDTVLYTLISQYKYDIKTIPQFCKPQDKALYETNPKFMTALLLENPSTKLS